MKKLFTLVALFLAISSFSQDITGSWYGFIDVQGSKLNLIFNISKTDSGYSTTMDSPDQGAKGIPFPKTSFENPKLKLEFPQAQIEYIADLNASNEFVGNFIQGGATFPMKLSREKTMKRPQEPMPPFAYYSEDVTFENKKEQITLAGTLTLPKKEGNYPVVVLISGSGPQNRDCELLGHKSFLVIADYLTKNGIGVLRFDDRGVGESQGDRNVATTKDFANDVAAAVDYLKTRKDINPKKIGLLGHSEGGIIAPIVAANSKDIKFMVLLAGTGVPGDALLLEQSYLIGKSSGMNETELAAAKASNQKIYAIIKNQKNPEEAKKQLAAVLQESFDNLPQDQKPTKEESDAILEQQMGTLLSPWFQTFIAYDPSIILKDVKCPVLVLNGEKDLQVPAKVNTEAIKNALNKGGNKKVTVVTYPNLNHLFQECTTGAVEEYSTIEQTFAPVALQQISDWIGLQVK